MIPLFHEPTVRSLASYAGTTVLIVSPNDPADPTGIATTVRRVRDGLRSIGMRAAVIAPPPTTSELIEIARRTGADVLHGFNARRTGPTVVEAAEAVGVAAVVTLTGTDIDRDLYDPIRGPVVRDVLSRADAVVSPRSQLNSVVMHAIGATPLFEISQTIALGEEPYDLRGALGIGETSRLVVLPAGLRPVKAPHRAVVAMTPLVERFEDLHLAMLGAPLDAQYTAELVERVAPLPWAHLTGSVSPTVMRACLETADVVLNTSVSEGLSNAVLEAMACGRPMIASRVEGNCASITHERNGLLFETEEDLTEAIARLLEDPSLAARLGEQARADVAERCNPKAEADSYKRIYREALTSTLPLLRPSMAAGAI